MENLSYWYLDNVFNKAQCKRLVTYIKKNHDGVESKKDKPKDLQGNVIKNTHTVSIRYKNIKKYLGDVPDYIKDINRREFGYIIEKLDNDSCILNTYKEGDSCGWHSDASNSPLFDCKLSVTIDISDKYEGGEFYIFQGGERLVSELKPGNLIIAKSYVNHRVAPVIKGERNTLTIFFNGPKMR